MSNQLKSFYDNLRKNEWREAASFGPSTNSRYRIITKLAQEYHASSPLLDVGCGIGVTISYLRRKFPRHQIDGCELSTEAIKLAKKREPRSNYFEIDLDAQLPK